MGLLSTIRHPQSCRVKYRKTRITRNKVHLTVLFLFFSNTFNDVLTANVIPEKIDGERPLGQEKRAHLLAQ